MKYPLIILIATISFVGVCQKSTPLYLSDTGNHLKPEYLKQLAPVFNRVKVIGLGESTHGTGDFTVMRGELFKYLVLNYGYTVFFLEADYGACSRINRYIHGAEDNQIEAMEEIRLWPWLTHELLDIVNWMRSYNQTHNQVLQFVGCDMQLISDDEVELNRKFKSDTVYHSCLTKMPSLKFNTKNLDTIRMKQKEWLTFSDFFVKAFPKEEKLLSTTITQWFEKETTETSVWTSFRDSCMGNNIADYLNAHPKTKGIYFAHNGHVSKGYNKRSPNTWRTNAGHFLDDRLKKEYFSIAFDFNVGTFNAFNYREKTFVLELFEIDKKHRNSIAYNTLKGQNKVAFVYCDSIQTKKIRYNSIGATYGNNVNGGKWYRFRNLRLNDYDGFILINTGAASHILNVTDDMYYKKKK